jgi:hypothetical protein
MKIAVVAENRPGISTTLMGEQVIGQLKDKGHEVLPVYVHGNAYKLMPEIARTPTISLSEHEMRGILRNTRYARPTALISVLTGDWEEHSFPDRMAYLAMFFEPVLNGVPIRHVSHSTHTTDLMLAEARTVFSPSIFRGLTQNVATHFYGVDLAFQPGENDPDVLIAPFNRIAQGAKNVVLHSELTHLYQAAAERRGFAPKAHLYFAPGHGPDEKGVKFRRESYAISQQPDTREGYVANARRCGMFFSVAQYESFGIYYLELLFAGAVGVFLDRPWVRRLIPEYPFIVKKDEIVPCLLHVRENYPAIRASLQETLLPMLRGRFSLAGFCDALVADLEAMIPLSKTEP